mgnify:CR=1 FL=1
MTTPADLFIIRIYVTYACRFMTFKGRYKKSPFGLCIGGRLLREV